MSFSGLLSIFCFLSIVVICTLFYPRQCLAFVNVQYGNIFQAITRSAPKPQGRFKLRMALSRPIQPWLVVDDNYSREHQIRKDIFAKKGSVVLGCQNAAHGACEELLQLVVQELLERYPARYKFAENKEVGTEVRITETGEVFPIEGPETAALQLKTAALLAMEDFNILIPDGEKGHRLQASASCFPVGWSVAERLGWPMLEVHETVPRWRTDLHKHVERFLSCLSSKIVERNAHFVQVADLEKDDMSEVLCLPHPPRSARPHSAAEIIVRDERQTFRRLPRTKAVVFTIKTSIKRLVDLDDAQLLAFAKEIRSWLPEFAEYKGRQHWGDCAEAYLAERLGDFKTSTMC